MIHQSHQIALKIRLGLQDEGRLTVVFSVDANILTIQQVVAKVTRFN